VRIGSHDAQPIFLRSDFLQVPKLLRFSGTIEKRKMDKKEILNLIEEIWEARLVKLEEKDPNQVNNKPSQNRVPRIDEKTAGPPISALVKVQKSMSTLQSAHDNRSEVDDAESFDEFVFEFLKAKYRAPSVIAYWSYNLLNGLEKYAKSDSSIEMFLMVLTGELSEDIFHDQCEMIKSLKILVMKIDVLWSNRQEGTSKPDVDLIGSKTEMAKTYVLSRHVPMKVLFAGLRKFFPLKTESYVQRLENAIERKLSDVTRRRQARAGLVAYDAFFLRENLMEKDSFLSILCDQHFKEIEELILRLDMTVAGKDKRDKGRLLLIDIRDALNDADPYITTATMKRYIKSGLGKTAKLEDVHWDMYTEYESFLTGLKASTLVKPSMLWDAGAVPMGPTSKNKWQGDRLEAITMELAEQQLSDLDEFPGADTFPEPGKLGAKVFPYLFAFRLRKESSPYPSQLHVILTLSTVVCEPGPQENNATNALLKKNTYTKATDAD
jgi:hypothetical protein